MTMISELVMEDVLTEVQAEVDDIIAEEERRAMLNLGCGRVLLPCAKPKHHWLVDDNIYRYPHWLNVDRSDNVGADEVTDLFKYPWPWADNAFCGALLSHIVEHIPHRIETLIFKTDRTNELESLPDGFYAFFAELWRVLEPDTVVHILAPSPWSFGFYADPSHTRPIVPMSFDYLRPDPDAPFAKDFGSRFEMIGTSYGFSSSDDMWGGKKSNYVQEYYIKLRTVKDDVQTDL